MILIITHIDIESGDEGEQVDCDDEDMNLLDELGKLQCQKENFEKKCCSIKCMDVFSICT